MFEKKSPSKLFRKIFNFFILFILSIFLFCLSIFICNFILKKTNYQNYYSFYDFAINGKSNTYTIDKDLIYRPRNNTDYRKEIIPTLDKKTIAMVGDSVTWSFGASDSATYPQEFENLYNKNHQKNPVTVYNYGVPGYGIDQEYVLIQNKILQELKPSIIIWNLNQNDIRDNNFMCLYRYQNNRWKKIPATRNIGYWYTWLNLNLPTKITDSKIFNYFWKNFSKLITNTSNESLYTFGCSTNLSFSSNYNKLASQHLLNLVQELQKQLKASNSELIVTLVPYQKNFYPNPGKLDTNYLIIKDTLKNTNIKFLDYNEDILNNLKKDSKDTNQNFDQEYFLDGSIDKNPNGIRHPNQKMYNLMAKTLNDYLTNLQLTL